MYCQTRHSKISSENHRPKECSDHDGRYWPGCVCSHWEWMAGLLTMGSAPDISNREWSYQLLSYLNDNQLPLQYTKSQLPYQIHPLNTHTHTHNTWYCELQIQWIRADINNSTKFLVIRVDPQIHSGHLFALSSISRWQDLGQTVSQRLWRLFKDRVIFQSDNVPW